MKNFLSITIFFYILFFGACLNTNESNEVKTINEGFTINGSLQGTENMLVRLEKAGEYVGYTYQTLDKIMMEDGAFSFEGQLDHAEMYYLYFEAIQKRVPLFLGNNIIEISGDIEKMQIEGSVLHSAFVKIIGQMEETDEDQRNIYLIDQAKINSNSMLGPYILVRYLANIMDYDELNPMVKMLNPKLLKSSYGQQLQSRIDVLVKVQVGEMAPDFQLPDNKSQMVSLSSLKGKLVLVDFWSTWCPPCREEIPLLVPIYKKYKDQGFEILAVSFEFPNNETKWKAYINDHAMSWINVSDFKGFDTLPGQLYAVKSLPSKIVVDANGKIIAKNPTIKELEQLIQNNLSK